MEKQLHDALATLCSALRTRMPTVAHAERHAAETLLNEYAAKQQRNANKKIQLRFAAVNAPDGNVERVICTAYTRADNIHVIDEVQAMLYWNGNIRFSKIAAAQLATLYPHINKVEECC